MPRTEPVRVSVLASVAAVASEAAVDAAVGAAVFKLEYAASVLPLAREFHAIILKFR